MSRLKLGLHSGTHGPAHAVTGKGVVLYHHLVLHFPLSTGPASIGEMLSGCNSGVSSTLVWGPVVSPSWTLGGGERGGVIGSRTILGCTIRKVAGSAVCARNVFSCFFLHYGP